MRTLASIVAALLLVGGFAAAQGNAKGLLLPKAATNVETTVVSAAAPSPAVVTGSFSATVAGAVSRTLKGTAVFEPLIGDDPEDSPGFHVDLHATSDSYRIEFLRELPRIPAAGHYVLGDAEAATQSGPAQFIATFRDHAATTYASRSGTLDISTVSAYRMAGRFRFRAGTDATVIVTGSFDASR